MAAMGSRGVLLKGLPFTSTVKEIKQFLKTLEVPDENIRLIKFRDGKGTGLCFVKLLDDDQMKRALLMDKNHIGQRYVEVMEANIEMLYTLQLAARNGDVNARELHKMCNENKRRSFRDRSPIRTGLQTKYAYVTGIPAGHHYKELRLFFAGILIGRNCIHLMRGHDSSIFRGDGYVQFGTVEECRKALALSGNKLGGATVTIEPCSREEFEAAVCPDGDRLDRGGGDWDSDRHRDFGRGRDRTPSPVRRRQEAYKARYDHDPPEYYTASYRDRESRYRDTIAMHAYGGEASFFGTAEPSRHNDRHLSDSYSLDSHHARPSLDLRDEYRRPPPSNYTSYHDSPIPSSKDEGRLSSSYRDSSSIGNPSGGMDPLPGGSARYPHDYQGSPQTTAAERRVVRVEGLPYDVTVHEIVAFFQNYNVGFEQVRIQCRDDGSPSGKAFVNFASEKLARTAIEGCNRRYIGKRFVELFMV